MEPVRLTVVGDQIEAEILCSLLRTEGVECAHRVTDFAAGAWDGLPVGGPREVLVRAEDLERAREIVAGAGR